jgi:hypothetical protein
MEFIILAKEFLREWAAPLGGIIKLVELIVACFTLLFAMIAVRRIRRAVDEIRSSADEVTDALEAKLQSLKAEFSELTDMLNDQFVSSREVPANQTTADDGLTNWNQIRTVWRATRERIEEKVLNIRDGRTRKKYAAKDWRDFNDIINSAASDGALTPTSRQSAVDMLRKFNAHKRRQAQVTTNDVADFEALAHRFGLKQYARPVLPHSTGTTSPISTKIPALVE